jgi:putative transposase
MSKYRSYHTTLKQLVKRKNLPDIYLYQIDRSTIWRWKQEEKDKYFGFELTNIEVLEQFICRKEAQRVMRSWLKVACTVSIILCKTEHFHNALKHNLTIFVKLVLKYQNDIDIKLLLRLCKVPLSVFYYWKNQVLKKCKASPLNLCRRIYPGQLTSEEVSVMKDLLQDERFRFWPVCSIAYYALRENLLSVSLATWYFYRKKLGIVRSVVPKKKRYSAGIVATMPNQIWHADITIVKTKDNIKHYVYLLMDNFSKFILTWRIEPVVSGKIRVETIREGYCRYATGGDEITLISDGGPENDNCEMKTFVIEKEGMFRSLIALKDIPFSNSVIEAQNRLFKYGYLFRQEYNNYDELKRVFAKDVTDYNDIRPHISLNGYTPLEVQMGATGVNIIWKDQIKDAGGKRIIANRKKLCELCQ